MHVPVNLSYEDALCHSKINAIPIESYQWYSVLPHIAWPIRRGSQWNGLPVTVVALTITLCNSSQPCLHIVCVVLSRVCHYWLYKYTHLWSYWLHFQWDHHPTCRVALVLWLDERIYIPRHIWIRDWDNSDCWKNILYIKNDDLYLIVVAHFAMTLTSWVYQCAWYHCCVSTQQWYHAHWWIYPPYLCCQHKDALCRSYCQIRSAPGK